MIVWVSRETRSLASAFSFPPSLSLSRLVVAMTTLTNAYQRSLPLGILAIASVYASPREPTISPHKNKQEIEKRAVDRGHKSRPRIPGSGFAISPSTLSFPHPRPALAQTCVIALIKHLTIIFRPVIFQPATDKPVSRPITRQPPPNTVHSHRP